MLELASPSFQESLWTVHLDGLFVLTASRVLRLLFPQDRAAKPPLRGAAFLRLPEKEFCHTGQGQALRFTTSNVARLSPAFGSPLDLVCFPLV